MSYPPPIYDGDSGEVSAHVLRARIEDGAADDRFLREHDDIWL